MRMNWLSFVGAKREANHHEKRERANHPLALLRGIDLPARFQISRAKEKEKLLLHLLGRAQLSSPKLHQREEEEKEAGPRLVRN